MPRYPKGSTLVTESTRNLVMSLPSANTAAKVLHLRRNRVYHLRRSDPELNAKRPKLRCPKCGAGPFRSERYLKNHESLCREG